MMTVRALAGRHEFADAVHLQRMIWGWDDLDILPVRFFVVASDIGGQILGAFDDHFLCGFCVAIPGVREGGRAYLHSHMLGVLPEYRDSGAGRALKLAQREDALARGFDLVEWTFDPLEIKNAYLNIEKLGAIARRYTVNQYGITTSPLQGALPTDRLVAEWWLKSRRVEAVLKGGCRPEFDARVSIPVPAEIYQWKANAATRRQAGEVQARNRATFQGAFESGFAVLGYERDQQGSGSFLLGSWDENWMY
jgi:predicted GNAT superfamily acetyltransferase